MNLKRKVLSFVTILLMIFMVACTQRLGSDTEPVLKENSILSPYFHLRDIEFSAGTAFAVELSDEREDLIVTALHLFGPSGGLNKQISSYELEYSIERVEFTDAFTGEECGECTQSLYISDAGIDDFKVDRDVAAFIYGKDMNVPKFKIAKKLPRKGESVWLAASVISAPEDKMLHKARVRHASDSRVTFEYEDGGIDLTATSGAPILNSKGEVVGINIGYIEDGSSVVGSANPCVSFKEMLKDSLN